MVVLVTGGSGQVGQALQSIEKNYPQIKFYFPTSSEVDITNSVQLSSVFETLKPDFCINAAAYTAVDKAESEQAKAYFINVIGTQNLAEICNGFGTTLLHISTDFVFDGNKTTPYSESDQTNPKGIYAQTKLEGEKRIAKNSHKHFIIRTSWVYSKFGNNFMKTMLRLATERESIGVVNDQIGTPTNAVDLAEALVAIIMSKSENYGIYHFSNDGETSWYNFAKEIFEVNSVDIILNPIPTTDFPTPANRPKYSVLDKTKISSTFGIKIKDWKNSLTR